MIDRSSATAWTLRLGDCLAALAEVPSSSVDLVYLDPPFSSGQRREGRAGLAFDDRFDSIEAYRGFLLPRLAQCHRVLSSTGSILVHIDWRTSHHVRFMLDEVFGVDRFVNHLVWSYGLGGSSRRAFARKHDDILFYGKTEDYWFEPPMVPARSVRLRGKMKKATDVLDIPSINNMALERTGWPTQKPEALLRVLVGACCPPGGTVLDPMCGSATTLAAALGMGRHGIGIDRSPEALAIARRRLEGCASRESEVIPTSGTHRAGQAVEQGPPGLLRTA